MRSLFERTKQVHMGMMEKAKGVLQEKDDMRLQMEEAFRAKEAVSAEANLLSCLSLDVVYPSKVYLAYAWSDGKCLQGLFLFGLQLICSMFSSISIDF